MSGASVSACHKVKKLKNSVISISCVVHAWEEYEFFNDITFISSFGINLPGTTKIPPLPAELVQLSKGKKGGKNPFLLVLVYILYF